MNHIPDGKNPAEEETFNAIKHLISPKDTLPPTGKPCNHSSDSKMTLIDKRFFQSWSIATSNSAVSISHKKRAIQRETDLFKMKVMLQSLKIIKAG